MPKATKKETKVTKRGKNTEVKKKRRAKKDPNAPKNALSAYLLFCVDHREKVRADNPNASFGEIGRILGQKWAALAPEKKTPYVEKQNAGKAKYAIEKAAYDAKKEESEEEEEEEDDD